MVHHFLVLRRAKTHKGRRLLDAKEPKLVENSKTTMFIRGGRTSETVTQALKDLVSILAFLFQSFKEQRMYIFN